MNVGNNSGTLLKQLIEDIVDLENVLIDHKETRKSKVEELKSNALPAAELIRVAKQDLDKVQDKAVKVQDAAGILGVEVYAGSVKPDAPVNLGDDTIQLAKDLTESILRIDEDIKSTTADIRAKYKEAKGAGFSVKVMKEIVGLKLGNADLTAFTEHSQLMTTYWQAVS